MRFPIHVLAVLVLTCLGGRADLVEQGPKNSAPSGLLAGVARADISPPVGIAQLNWGSQTHVGAEGIDPAGMVATALVVSDGRQKFAMVDIDTLSVREMEEVIARAAAATGIPAAHIRLGATHTHAGPMLTGEKGPVGVDLAGYREVFRTWREAMAHKIVGAVVEANSRLHPAHLHGARGTGSININRRVRAAEGRPAAVGRNPEGFVDRELVVARIDDAEGKPLAVLVNYQCHGTVLAYENRFVSPDWIGMTRRVVERALPGALCLFFQGAAGNQGPVEGFTGDLRVAHRLGSVLGHQAAALAVAIETTRREPRFEGFVESTAYQARQPWRVAGPRDATLKFATATVQVPRRRYTAADIDRMETQLAGARAKAAEAAATGDPSKKHQAEARVRRFADLLEKWKKPWDATPIDVQVQMLRIGELAIVAMPGEPFAEIGAAIRKASPFAVTMFCGYSSGDGGDYMPIASEYAHGGYEIERTPYAPEAAAKVVRESSLLYGRIR